MKIETREPLKRWVSLIVENVLPRGLRQQYMDESAEYCSSLSQFVPDSAVNIAGTGRGIQPSSRAFVKYASEPTRRSSNAAPAFRIASFTAGPSSHGPKNSHPFLKTRSTNT